MHLDLKSHSGATMKMGNGADNGETLGVPKH